MKSLHLIQMVIGLVLVLFLLGCDTGTNPMSTESGDITIVCPTDSTRIFGMPGDVCTEYMNGVMVSRTYYLDSDLIRVLWIEEFRRGELVRWTTYRPEDGTIRSIGEYRNGDIFKSTGYRNDGSVFYVLFYNSNGTLIKTECSDGRIVVPPTYTPENECG